MLNILTVDVEDWYTSSLALLHAPAEAYGQRPHPCVVANTGTVLSLLRKHGARATFFVPGTVAEHYPALVREIYAQGHEVATHGYSHRLIYQMTPEEFGEDLDRGMRLLQETTGASAIGYRAPYFSITQRSLWALDTLAERGIRYDSSIVPVGRGLYGMPGASPYPRTLSLANGASLLEVPPSSVKVLGRSILTGGGYMRLLPYYFIRWALSTLNAGGIPGIVYFHPYELDPKDLKTPSGPPGLFLRLSQGVNRSRTLGKLRRLLTDFSFGSIREVFDVQS